MAPGDREDSTTYRSLHQVRLVSTYRLQNNRNLSSGHDVRRVKTSAGREVANFCINPRLGPRGKTLKFRHSKHPEIAISVTKLLIFRHWPTNIVSDEILLWLDTG